jgi:DNA-directed RNA polymerase specialized sigma24 family protein
MSKRSRRRAAAQNGFESFYRDVRDRLLLQTYALTGDLHASEKAVRDALIVAWHHWGKVSRLDDPEDWVRPLAWTRALRRSSARWWSRQKGITQEAKETLDSLAKLSTLQRKVLLLTHLTALPLDGMARELGATRTTVERELQNATSLFAMHRDAASTSIRELLEGLDDDAETVRWPRPSILMRAGSARRRSHTTVGAAAAVAALFVSGALVTDAAGVRPGLETKGITEGQKASPREHEKPPPDPLPAEALLSTEQVSTAFPGHWNEGRTSRNTAGDGLVFTCQGGRYADSAGVAALVRMFRAEPRKGSVTVGQAVEASTDEAAATQTFETTESWYAGCTTPSVQLLATYTVSGAGDDATLFVLRGWDEPVTTQIVGVARTGSLTTTTVHKATSRAEPNLKSSAQLLADAVQNLCSLPDGGACASRARAHASAPLAAGAEPSMLSEADLPPVREIVGPWVGTDPVKATDNVAATRCEDADFSTAEFSQSMTRSFLIPSAPELPAEFGLTQTVGALPEASAEKFVADVRRKLAACPDEDLGTEVARLLEETKGERELTVWRLSVEISQDRSVRFLMAIIRNGTAVSQVTFVPSGEVTMASEAFIKLGMRAQARLAELGPPGG